MKRMSAFPCASCTAVFEESESAKTIEFSSSFEKVYIAFRNEKKILKCAYANN